MHLELNHDLALVLDVALPLNLLSTKINDPVAPSQMATCGDWLKI
jgi:hypothetical protein